MTKTIAGIIVQTISRAVEWVNSVLGSNVSSLYKEIHLNNIQETATAIIVITTIK
jgi:hypothetical protein